MKPLEYDPKQKRRASTLLALCQSELEAAEVLVEKELPREAVIHLYFSCYYASQAVLAEHLKQNPSHKNVEATLHKVYGKHRHFPRRYVELHSFLHKLRNDHSYKESHIPSPKLIEQKLRVLQFYVKLAYGIVPKVETLEIIEWIYEKNNELIRDFSYDIYCPKTYSHHTRLTFWQPPFYRHMYSPDAMVRNAKRMLKALKVRRVEDYVVGLNSRMDQYKAIHLILLDIDTLDSSVEAELKAIGGVLLKSGRGFHFIGRKLLTTQTDWEKEMRRIRRHKLLKHFVDHDHIDISLRRGYATLRITSSKAKPRVPVFYKEL